MAASQPDPNQRGLVGLDREEQQPLASFRLGEESSTERLHEMIFVADNYDECVDGAGSEGDGYEDESYEESEGETGSSSDDPLYIHQHHHSSSAATRSGKEIIEEEIRKLLRSRQEGGGDFEDEEDYVRPGIIQRMDSRDVSYSLHQAWKFRLLNDKYFKGGPLGEGSYAKVKEIVDKDTLRRMAVKIFKDKTMRKQARGLEALRVEKSVMAKLKHDNVTTLLDSFRNDEKGKTYLVMEYCVTSLRNMLEYQQSPNRFPEWQARKYFIQLVQGLEYLHETAGVIHGDVKPENLLLDSSGTLKITDFGSAVQLDPFAPDDRISPPQTTPMVTPPECAKQGTDGELFSGYKIDIWSSGVTLYNFVTGRYPFENSENIYQLIIEIAQTEVVVIPEGLSDFLTPFLQKVLELDPDKRIALREIKSDKWFLQKQAEDEAPLPVPPRSKNCSLEESLAFQAIRHHVYDPPEEGDTEEVTVTEHELNEQHQLMQDYHNPNGHAQDKPHQGKKKSRAEATGEDDQQEGNLCAQHCLNTLLQGSYFTAVDLATLATQLDEDERKRMAEGGDPNDPEYRKFLAQPSANMDDTGFFSVQVISRAIAVWGLELVSFSSMDERAAAARASPASQSAFICNFEEHWFTIRRIGNQWFNLNSLLTGPELISDTFLMLFLAQLQQEGYSIYVVAGVLPHCDTDDVLRACPVTQSAPPQLLRQASGSSQHRATTSSAPPGPSRPAAGAAAAPAGAASSRTAVGRSTGAVPRLTPAAMSAAMAQAQSSLGAAALPSSFLMDEDAALRRAMEMSLAHHGGNVKAKEDEDLQLAIKMSQSMIPGDPTEADPVIDQSNITSEEDAIQQAIEMSLKSAKPSAGKGATATTSRAPAVKPPAEKPRKSWKERREEEERKKRAAEIESKFKAKASKDPSTPASASSSTASVSSPFSRPSARTGTTLSSYPSRPVTTFTPSGGPPPPGVSMVPPPSNRRYGANSSNSGSNVKVFKPPSAASSNPTSPPSPGVSPIAAMGNAVNAAGLGQQQPRSLASSSSSRIVEDPPHLRGGRTSLVNSRMREWEMQQGQRLGGDHTAGYRTTAEIRQSTPDPEEVRRKRMAFLEKMEQKKE